MPIRRRSSAGAKLRDYAHRELLDGTGDVYSWAGFAYRRGQGEIDRGQYDELLDVFGACGAVALYRRTAFEDVGEPDERFYALCEDVDWSFRAQLAGLRCRYVPAAIAYHIGSASLGPRLSEFTLYHNWRNQIWIIAKDYPGWDLSLTRRICCSASWRCCSSPPAIARYWCGFVPGATR